MATFSPSGRPLSSQILAALVPSVMPGRDNAWNPLRHSIAWFLGEIHEVLLKEVTVGEFYRNHAIVLSAVNFLRVKGGTYALAGWF